MKSDLTETQMVNLRLPDGSVKKFPKPVTGMEVAEEIGPGLAKAALAIRVNGEVADLKSQINADSEFSVVTASDGDALELIRHDAAHVLAQSVQELFPDTQVTIGPAIENGFYYDFAREAPFSSDDFSNIEKRMEEIVDRDLPIEREIWDRNKAIEYFKSKGESYKAELIQDLPQNEEIIIYKQGDWIDLCRGPHLPSTGKLPLAFKLTKIAGAYWRGDSTKEMLQRMYGTAWANKKQLANYLTMLEEAEKRDHRRLGREMDLFHLQEHAVGSVFWHPKGWTLYRIIMDYIRVKLELAGYQEVNTPQLVDSSLWKDSGHWDKFREQMFISEVEDKVLAIKPMNCPCHVQIFRQGIKSYKELPIRMAEFGSCHRNEPSGALHGLMRVRAFTQDDAHIFCTEDQIVSETEKFCSLLMEIYKAFGFENIQIKFSDRPENRAGENKVWDQAEKALIEAVEVAGYSYELNPGEGAFYGPKLEFVLRDAIGRDWQCGTLQVDFVLPERLDANYVGADGVKHRPVMLHRAILGSFERFIGILIENYAGRLPIWLSPVQVAVVSITDANINYGEKVLEEFNSRGIRTISDFRNEKINYKIREHSTQKIPVIVVVGDKEEKESSVSIRRLGDSRQETVALTDAIDKLEEQARVPVAW
ncbi:MAG: Threonine--tRNA ligase [Alphaproteobacteria bacterium MarineAlpha3_Bin7]|nr:MAG: Threonine--tRNA ligase [Alphaproteobacteria bacterium MarineAlpha3_Bin7]|tara:strand:- start:350 stop:2293 length:1944 start_codon:yes stop_codon:yes gene_type:complete